MIIEKISNHMMKFGYVNDPELPKKMICELVKTECQELKEYSKKLQLDDNFILSEIKKLDLSVSLPAWFMRKEALLKKLN